MSVNSIKNTNQNPKAILLAPFVGVNQIFNQEDLFKLKTSLASDRLQIKPLIKALHNLGYDTSAASLNTTFQLTELDQLKDYDLCIASKMRCNETINENQFTQFHTCCAIYLKRQGTKLMTIYSDHVAEVKSIDSELYKNLLYLSDHVVTPSRKLESSAREVIGHQLGTSLIEDPCQFKKQDFNNLNPEETIRLLWFGNLSNLQYLLRELKNLLNKSTKLKNFELTILTSEPGITHIKTVFGPGSLPVNWSLRLTVWNIHQQPKQFESELSRAHVTLLPSDAMDPRKNGVSHNRLTDSIQGGCIAIASPVDSYIELSKVSLVGNDFPKLLDFAVAHYPRLCDKYSKLRDAALERFKPSINIKKWESAIQQTMNFQA